ncbi:GNAT family N-acetyltransferase [Halomicroarcula limicola]|uniref:GNAT family N-acetyltransferase n=1 Tax=Haloarcula limicola TaxID=1429915 RepID=A0A8J8C460_9EURY|nr:GNAT family N-acetyltransferase [Halomicroarcula limicola]MBV0925211.1 GNAT family N-acetyltransferase [Halomicroarcula limicola]
MPEITATVSRISESEFNGEWQSFVQDHPIATPFHSSRWLDAVASTFGYDERQTLVYRSDRGEPIAAIPGFLTPEFLGRSIVNPFCEYGFPLLAPDVAQEPVFAKIDENAGLLHARIIKETEWSGVSRYNCSGYGGLDTGISIRLPTTRSYDDVWNHTFKKRARKSVRSAQRDDLTISTGSVDSYYPLYVSTMERLGSPQFPKAFFRALKQNFGAKMRILLAQREETPVAGILCLEWNGEKIVWSNASIPRFWDDNPNHLLYATAIKAACESDVQVIDFGRSQTESSVHQFKSQFGGHNYRLTSFVDPPHRTPRADIEGYGRLAPLTKRLSPIVTQRHIGPQLKRFLHE